MTIVLLRSENFIEMLAMKQKWWILQIFSERTARQKHEFESLKCSA